MSRFAKIQEALKPMAADKPNEDEELPENPDGKPTPKSKKKDKVMPEVEEGAAANAAQLEAAREEGVKAANARMNAVFASEHYPGREAHAAKLLGKNMSAEDIIDVLADFPKVETQAVDPEVAKAAAEEAARKEMAEAIEQSGNSNVDAGADSPKTDKRAAADQVWAKARPLADKGVK